MYLLGLAVSNLCVLIIAIPALIAITSPQCSKAYAKAYFQVIECLYGGHCHVPNVLIHFRPI